MAEQKRKAKRNNYTLTPKAQSVIDDVPKKEKSRYVSNLIEHFKPIVKDGKFSE